MATGSQLHGYDIDQRAGRVVIDSEAHWRQWVFADQTVDILPTGEVRPHYWRKNTNVVPDIPQALRWNPPEDLARKAPEDITILDAVDGGSNRADMGNMFDGDMSTYWEPSFPEDRNADLGARWWFTLNLGKLVLADAIVLKFVDEGEGDPFLLFDVMVSDGQKPPAALFGGSLEYLRVFQTLRPNKNQRVFEIDLTQFSDVDAEQVGTAHSGAVLAGGQVRKRFIRYVQVVVGGSAFERGEQITEQEYERLRQEAPQARAAHGRGAGGEHGTLRSALEW